MVARKTMSSGKVDLVTGIIRSNVLAAVLRAVVRNRVILASTDAGRSQRAGRPMQRYFIDTSWNNDRTFEAMGESMRNAKNKPAFTMAPNNRAGKDMLADFQRYYKDTGKIAGRTVNKSGRAATAPLLLRLVRRSFIVDGFVSGHGHGHGHGRSDHGAIANCSRPWTGCNTYERRDGQPSLQGRCIAGFSGMGFRRWFERRRSARYRLRTGETRSRSIWPAAPTRAGRQRRVANLPARSGAGRPWLPAPYPIPIQVLRRAGLQDSIPDQRL